jgi:hypothetical protein
MPQGDVVREVICMRDDDQYRHTVLPFSEHYQRMNEEEKDIETNKAILRLHNLMLVIGCSIDKEVPGASA